MTAPGFGLNVTTEDPGWIGGFDCLVLVPPTDLSLILVPDGSESQRLSLENRRE